ncbi:MAG: transport permease protein [Planctomycetota bacterium]|nr:MAG: transport permease protein [Planctomycetota bacterium]
MSDSAAGVLAAGSLARREVVRFLRQPGRIVGAVATPVLFWFLLGSGLGRSFNVEGVGKGGYLEYAFAGALAMVVLFTAIFSTITVIEDRREGFLQGVLASPAPRASVVAGKIVGATVLAVVQAGLLLILAPVTGVRVSVGGIVHALAVLTAMAGGLSGLGLVAAWRAESVQGYHAVMNLVMMPMWLLSGAVFPASGASGWMQAVMAVNPLTYGVAELRSALGASREALTAAGAPGAFASWVMMIVFAAVMIAAGERLASRRPGA